MSARTYTMSYTTRPSIFSNVLIRLEHALTYMGFVVGIILVFENLVNLFNGKSENAMSLLMLGTVVWMGGYISRMYFNKDWKSMKLKYSAGEWLRVEFMYFLFSYTFTTLFITIFLRYFPSVSFSTQLNKFSAASDYLNSRFVINLTVHSIMALLYILGVLTVSEYLYQTFFMKDKYFNKDKSGLQTAKIALISLLLLMSYILLSIPAVSSAFDVFYKVVVGFLVGNMAWLVDYAIAFPIFYYLFVSYKGSFLAEKFSTHHN